MSGKDSIVVAAGSDGGRASFPSVLPLVASSGNVGGNCKGALERLPRGLERDHLGQRVPHRTTGHRQAKPQGTQAEVTVHHLAGHNIMP